MTQDELKQAVARAALAYVVDGAIIGVGTGSTANFFIDELGKKDVIQFLNEELDRTSARSRNNFRVDLSSIMQALEDSEVIELNFVKKMLSIQTAAITGFTKLAKEHGIRVLYVPCRMKKFLKMKMNRY